MQELITEEEGREEDNKEEKEEYAKISIKRATVDLDGNCLCVMPKGFINLAESEAFFVELTPKQLREWKQFISKVEYQEEFGKRWGK